MPFPFLAVAAGLQLASGLVKKPSFKPSGTVTRTKGSEQLLDKTVTSIENTFFPENLASRFRGDAMRLLQSQRRLQGKQIQAGGVRGPQRATGGRALRSLLSGNAAQLGLATAGELRVGEARRGTELGRLGNLQKIPQLLAGSSNIRSQADLIKNEINQASGAQRGRAFGNAAQLLALGG